MALQAKPETRAGVILSASIVACLVTMWAICVAIAYDEYRVEPVRARLFGANIAKLLAQDLSRNAEMIDSTLRGIVADTLDPAVMGLPTTLRRKVLFDRSAEAFGLGSTMVLDSSGHIVDDSNYVAPPAMDFSDREYFKAQQSRQPIHQPYISLPHKGRLMHRLVVTFSRPRLAADGHFEGVVARSMTLDYLSMVFRAIQLPKDSTISLIRDDGRILMRAPLTESQLGIKLPEMASIISGSASDEGFFTRRSIIDGVERLCAYRRVGTMSSYVVIGLSTQEFLAGWHSRVKTLGLSVGAISIVILALAFMLARELRRRTRAEAALQALALTDGLTLLANRRRFDEAIESEWRRAIRDDTPISLLMIDADFFKAYNDSFGHLGGDAALRALAETLKSCGERAGDLVARFGGEEFVVLLPKTDRDGAVQLAEAIRRAVLALALPHPRNPTGFLTVSIGGASRRPTSKVGPSVLIQSADAALYRAKADGRNRIVVEGGEPRFGWRSTRAPRVA